jgi:hypothetical protein
MLLPSPQEAEMANPPSEAGDPPLLRVSGSLTNVPPYVWILIGLGIPISGGAGSVLGAQANAEQTIASIARLEAKQEELSDQQEKLDRKLDELKYVLLRSRALDGTGQLGEIP